MSSNTGPSPFLRACLMASCGLALGGLVWAQDKPAPQPAPQPTPQTAAQPANRPASGKAPAASRSAAARQQTHPLWSELSPSQRQALTPLAGSWDPLSEAQKRKWLALSQNYPQLTPTEQQKLHSRMTEWVALSPQQRTQARLNFGKTKQLSPDDKKAKWEAYQALSPEEKSKLAAKAAKPPVTAAAIRPVPAEKLARVPPPAHGTRPRIAAGPNQVDPNTLLPQPGAPGAPAGRTN